MFFVFGSLKVIMLVIVCVFKLVTSERLCAFKLIAYQFVFDFSAPVASDFSAPVEGSDRRLSGSTCDPRPCHPPGSTCDPRLNQFAQIDLQSCAWFGLHVCARIYLRSSACQV